ncbi:putative helicase mov-10-B.1 [Topomyia yanbarensis]|uniref:putative helicase mov-10-B.1 n=1 Tax=Topomyia yanbarensis TaxID=2498891 RepID=UPI00273AB7AF|nr:putative helicase mov-10-B.1 [Topomyia yanbarensis]
MTENNASSICSSNNASHKPKATVKEILQNVLARCYTEGLLSHDGVVASESVFRYFSSDVFRLHRQDVRLREFQALMERSSLVIEKIDTDRKQYRIDVNRLQAELDMDASESTEERSCTSSVRESASLESIISSLQFCSLTREERYRETITADFAYVSTFKRPLDTNFLIKGRCCIICRLNFPNAMDFHRHVSVHGPELTMQESPTLRQTRSPLLVTLRYDECQLMSTLVVTNIDQCPLIIDYVCLYHERFELFAISTAQTCLECFDSRSFLIPNNILSKSHQIYSLFLVFRRPYDRLDFVEQYHINVYGTRAEPVGYRSKKSNHLSRKQPKRIRLSELEDYLPSKELCSVVANCFRLSSDYTEKEKQIHESIRYLCTTDFRKRLNAANYCEMFEMMVHVHDLNVQCDLSRYRADNAVLTPTDKPRMYQIETAHFNELPTNLAEGDVVKITVESPDGGCTDRNGVIMQILYDHFVIELEERIEANCRVKVNLQVNRIVCRLELQALAAAKRDELAQFLFPDQKPRPTNAGIAITSWYNRSLMENPEQQAAVLNIVNRTSYPLPYVLFGPPGTGKTTTLVEAIVQICTRSSATHILVTTQSNSACDDITLRLMKHLPPEQLYRFFSRSSEKRIDELSEELKRRSNLAEGRHRWPTWEDIYQARVVICSLSVCGRLVQSRIRTNHFDYVFIDECGSASEPAALVAIAGLVTSKKKLHASVIVAGDPHQLGPVIRSEIADKMGLGISMLERLMNLPIYQKWPETKVYNQQLITKLLRNYRSHRALIQFANKQFYGSELIPVAPKEEVSLAENWKWLPNKSFPIILHTVFGNNERIDNSKSLTNVKEIETAEFYLEFILRTGVNGRKITQDEIGIISPYQLQAQQLRQMCLRREWPSVEIGSVEQYQGREKLIIILSTVRSHTPGVGFLNNVKRLNVAMTRAKALLIVIGNSCTLQTDPNWYEFIKYCTEHRATVGRCFDLTPSRIVKRSKREEMFDTLFNSLV